MSGIPSSLASCISVDEDTIYGLFSAQAVRNGEKLALVGRGQSVTYRMLNEVSNSWAHELMRCGVKPGDIVPISIPRSMELVACLLAVLKAGAAYSILSPEWPLARCHDLVRQTGASLLISEAQDGWETPVFVPPAWADTTGSPAPPRAPKSTGEAAAAVFFTSGSTGTPKAVVSPHRGMVRLLNDPVLASFVQGVMPLNAALPWDAFSLELWGMLLSGGTSVLPEGPYLLPDGLRAMISLHGVNTLWLTASLFNMFVEEDLQCFMGLTLLIIGGERLSPQHVRVFLQTHPGIRLVNGYGPVESTVFATVHDIVPGDCDRESGIPIGRPLAHTDVYVIADGMPCESGRQGEIYIGGHGLAHGYLAQPKLTAEKFVTLRIDGRERRLYRTGDIGHWTRDGLLAFDGRYGRQVKLRGHRIELGEIETVFSALDGVTGCVAVPMPDANGTVRSIALFFTASDSASSEKALRERLAVRLPGHLLPDYIERVPRFPLSANGKIDQAGLISSLSAVTTAAELPARTPPAQSPADRIAQVFSEVLGRQDVPSDVSFFALGGTSLDAGRVCVRLSRLLSMPVPVSLLAANPTMKAFTRSLVSAEPRTPPSSTSSALPGTLPDPLGPVELIGTQSGFAMAHAFEPDDLSPLCLLVWKVKGSVNAFAMEHALQDVSQRHQALRALYESIPRPVAWPRTDAGSAPEILDLLTSTGDEKADLEHLYNRLIQPLAIERGEVWRGMLLSSKRHTLLGLTVHHVAFDGWSQRILIEDLSHAYEARSRGTAPQFRTRAPSLAEIARQRRVRQASIDLVGQRKFWENTVVGLPELDFGGQTAGKPSTCAIHEVTLAAEDLAAVDLIAAAAGTTRFVVLLDCYAEALRATLGQDAFGVGVPVAQRDLAAADRAVGCLINTVCVAFINRADGRFASLKSTHASVMRAFAAQDIPFPDVVRAVRPARSARTPLFQTIFALQDMEQRSLTLPDCSVEYLHVPTPRAMNELVVEAWPQPEGSMRIIFGFRPDSLSEATVRAVGGAYATALSTLIEETNARSPSGTSSEG
jgi:mycobactin peptide synthetase MbtE